jgi:hypothetical protein
MMRRRVVRLLGVLVTDGLAVGAATCNRAVSAPTAGTFATGWWDDAASWMYLAALLEQRFVHARGAWNARCGVTEDSLDDNE